MHGGRDVTERSGWLILKTPLSPVTPVVRTENTITQKFLRPRQQGAANEICKVRNEVKKPNDLSATGGNGNAKAGKGTKANSGWADAQSKRINARKTRNENETRRND